MEGGEFLSTSLRRTVFHADWETFNNNFLCKFYAIYSTLELETNLWNNALDFISTLHVHEGIQILTVFILHGVFILYFHYRCCVLYVPTIWYWPACPTNDPAINANFQQIITNSMVCYVQSKQCSLQANIMNKRSVHISFYYVLLQCLLLDVRTQIILNSGNFL